MLTENQILFKLDNFRFGYYCQFLDLGNPSSFLIDCRLNVFLGDEDKWAIVGERLGYSQQAGYISLDICYHGNCLSNLEHYNGQDINYYSVYPVDMASFNNSTDGFTIKPGDRYWMVRGKRINVSNDIQTYKNAGIDLKEFEPNTISVEEAARLIVSGNREIFRATDQELSKSIPQNLKKILVLDEWYHRDFRQLIQPKISDEQLEQLAEVNRKVQESLGIDKETFVDLIRQQEARNEEWDKHQWDDNRPSSYETWQQIAKVISTGDLSFYSPTSKSNTHWSNWPESGSI